MSERWECAYHHACEVGLMTGRSLDEQFGEQPDVLALTIGDPWSSAYAIFGSRIELKSWLQRAWAVVQGEPDDSRWQEAEHDTDEKDEERCECEDEIVPGAFPGFNDRDEVVACELCDRFDTDEDAAKALAERVGGVAVERHDPDLDTGAYYWVIEKDGKVMTDEDMTAVVLAEVAP